MRTLRVGLALLVVTQAVLGVWALAAPRGFYDGFPTTDHAWVALFPPFNEHLLRDFGGLNLGLGVVLAFAAVSLERTLVRAALLGYLAFAVPHLVFHLGHLEHLSAFDLVGNVVSLGLSVVLPLVLLALTRSAAGAVIVRTAT